jgi:hypothetical protein
MWQPLNRYQDTYTLDGPSPHLAEECATGPNTVLLKLLNLVIRGIADEVTQWWETARLRGLLVQATVTQPACRADCVACSRGPEP